MLKTPTTRKLSEKKVFSAADKDGNLFQKLFPDEKFYQYPNYPNVFVSQYGNVITTYSKTPLLRQLYYNPETGYTNIVLSKRGKRDLKYIHVLVAEIWLQKPSFQLDDSLEVHHKEKVKDNLQCQSINVNFAENLVYVYKKYHSALENIKTMKYLAGKRWRKFDDVEALSAETGVSAYEIYELISKDPQDIQGKEEIYSNEHIQIKIRRNKK